MKRGPQLILLHEADTILVCTSPIRAGEPIQIDGASIAAPEAINVGHKVARFNLAAGDKVIKYGAPIGSIVAPTPIGGWVHVHNMKSDYIASHSRETVSREEK
jgi:D-threo-aldose 1-dehydrogenase